MHCNWSQNWTPKTLQSGFYPRESTEHLIKVISGSTRKMQRIIFASRLTSWQHSTLLTHPSLLSLLFAYAMSCFPGFPAPSLVVLLKAHFIISSHDFFSENLTLPKASVIMIKLPETPKYVSPGNISTLSLRPTYLTGLPTFPTTCPKSTSNSCPKLKWWPCSVPARSS